MGSSFNSFLGVPPLRVVGLAPGFGRFATAFGSLHIPNACYELREVLYEVRLKVRCLDMCPTGTIL